MRQWRTVKELVTQLRFPTDAACREWLRRQNITTIRRGRVLLVDQFDIDRALHVRKPTALKSSPQLISHVRAS